MRKFISSLILALGFTSASAFAGGIDVDFDGACAHGDFDVQGGDIEFFNLDLDIIWGKTFEKKKCDISVKIPMRHGYYIAVNKFKIEGFADIESRHGFASLQVKHKGSGDWGSSKRDVTRKSDDLVVSQKAIAKSKCNKSILFRTRIEVKTFKADFFQDAAQSNISGINYKYVRCH